LAPASLLRGAECGSLTTAVLPTAMACATRVSERQRVDADRTGDTAGQTRWASARGERPRSSERDLLCALDGLPMAGVAEGSAAEEHRAFLFHAVGLGRHAERIHHALYVEIRER